MTKDTTTQWLSTKAASTQLGVTARTLYRMIDQDGLPAYRFGRVFRLKQDEMDAWLHTQRVEAGSLANLYPSPVGDR